ncbi:MAG: hypothetical protein ACREJ0_03810 [Geminicoccaceae bacterium]
MSPSPTGAGGSREPPSTGTTAEIWKLVISSFGVIATVGGLLYGVWTYFDQRNDQIKQRGLEIEQRGLEIEALQRESKKKFLDKQFDLYVDVVSTVSRLTTNPAYDGREQDLARFWQLYWGDLGIVEDRGVEKAMVALGQIIPDMASRPQLARRASLNLSHCIKNSMSESWGVELGQQPCLSYAELVGQ